MVVVAVKERRGNVFHRTEVAGARAFGRGRDYPARNVTVLGRNTARNDLGCLNGFAGKVDVATHFNAVNEHHVRVATTTAEKGSAAALVLNDAGRLRKDCVHAAASQVADLIRAKARRRFSLFNKGGFVLGHDVNRTQFHAGRGKGKFQFRGSTRVNLYAGKGHGGVAKHFAHDRVGSGLNRVNVVVAVEVRSTRSNLKLTGLDRNDGLNQLFAGLFILDGSAQ